MCDTEVLTTAKRTNRLFWWLMSTVCKISVSASQEREDPLLSKIC
jgi:hypothetical protein